MSVSEKDLKILWGKAAGRCAITKKQLVAKASKEIPSQNIVLGKVCHIVADSEKGSRGTSILTPEERDSYPNPFCSTPGSMTLSQGFARLAD